MNFLKQTLMLLGVLGLSLQGISCSGNSDEETQTQTEGKVTLTPSIGTIKANGSDAVTFKVYDGTAEVTASAVIRCVNDDTTLSGATFSTRTPGDYTFTAIYANRTSDPVKVVAIPEDQPQVPSQFVRHICVMEFTGQWCANCPSGYNYMNYIISRKFADVAHVIALHDNEGGKDDLALPVQKKMASAFGVKGYPAAVVDLRDLCPLTDDLDNTFRKSIESSQNDYPAHCGVAVKSVYDPAAKQAVVTVRLYPEKSAGYRVALWVVEDGITAPQNVLGKYENNYVHNHVARKLVSAVDQDYSGERLGDLTADKEASKDFTVAVDPSWNPDNTFLFALAIDDKGYVNNMAICKIVDGDTDYDRISE